MQFSYNKYTIEFNDKYYVTKTHYFLGISIWSEYLAEFGDINEALERLREIRTGKGIRRRIKMLEKNNV